MKFSLQVQKRILSDLRELEKDDDLKKNGVFWTYDENNIKDIWVCIFGNDKTPYENCPFFFTFEFSNQYPLKPPKVTFLTSDGYTRFNPNLYVDGLVCLSILGTWKGPSWTPVMTLKSIIMILSSMVLHEKPLQNEPGLENSLEKDIDDYNKIIQFKSIDYAYCYQLQHLLPQFEPIKNEILQYAKEKFEKIYVLTKELKEKYNGEIVKPKYGYGMNVKLEYDKTLQKLKELQ